MSKKLVDEAHAKEALKEMINDRKPNEPVAEVFPVFCQRYGVPMATCRSLYDELAAESEIEEK
jgi:hypothetical protein